MWDRWGRWMTTATDGHLIYTAHTALCVLGWGYSLLLQNNALFLWILRQSSFIVQHLLLLRYVVGIIFQLFLEILLTRKNKKVSFLIKTIMYFLATRGEKDTGISSPPRKTWYESKAYSLSGFILGPTVAGHEENHSKNRARPSSKK